MQLQALVEATTRKASAADDDVAVCAEGVQSLCDELPDREADTPGLPAARTRGLQTGNPGFPGYTHGGYVVSAGLEIRWHY